MSGRVVVVGSINVDLVVAADHLPQPGESVLGGSFEQHFGGKGANQAVAAARAGAKVSMIGAVGEDASGVASLDALRAEGIDVAGVRRVAAPTGVAIIAVDRAGDNQIVVAPGANAEVRPEDVAFEAAPREPAILVTGFEVPTATAIAAVRAAREASFTRILNPAPAAPLSAELLELGAIVVPNEREISIAVGEADMDRALETLSHLNAGPVVVTRGAAGALLADGALRQPFPGFDVAEVVDTTGAGDAFIGVLAAWLAAGHSLKASIVAANAAGAISVRRSGAREGMPSLTELRAFLSTQPQSAE
jgi:ribokinase